MSHNDSSFRMNIKPSNRTSIDFGSHVMSNGENYVICDSNRIYLYWSKLGKISSLV